MNSGLKFTVTSCPRKTLFQHTLPPPLPRLRQGSEIWGPLPPAPPPRSDSSVGDVLGGVTRARSVRQVSSVLLMT